VSLTGLAADEVRRITGFDRVLVYRFDANWDGHVIAESRNDELPSYLDLWFPASDIPAQARELYRLNRLRLIADAGYNPVPLVPQLDPRTDQPLDLSFSTLRSVSPIHIEYLHNMGVAASMSISVIREGALWGLIALHNKTPRKVDFEARSACDFLGQALSSQLGALENRAEYEHRLALQSITAKLLSYMAEEEHFIQGLLHHPDELLSFADAAGAAVLFEGRCNLLGRTPTEQQVWQLVDWLSSSGYEEIFSTATLPSQIPDGEVYREAASGVLAIGISKLYRSYVIWFRPEVVQTVKWGGDPRKPVAPGSTRLHPRTSFETWKETVRGRSLPWRAAEIDSATELRNAVVGIVLRKAEELAALSAELQRSNKELEAFSYSVSHDLRAPFRHIVGYADLLRDHLNDHVDETASRYLSTIVGAAETAGTLVDNLLNFARIGRARLNAISVDMNLLVREVLADLEPEYEKRQVRWSVGSLPRVQADPVLMRLVWHNLLSNALKYTRRRDEAHVTIECQDQEEEYVFLVADNGVGFKQQYVGKLFAVFQRLHGADEFEGTGIGLANVRRAVGRHGGRTWAEGELDVGARFYFSLPKRIQTERGAHA
jgi:light-regulated signal transduction histidine kinase (bacteriophytochrome)